MVFLVVSKSHSIIYGCGRHAPQSLNYEEIINPTAHLVRTVFTFLDISKNNVNHMIYIIENNFFFNLYKWI